MLKFHNVKIGDVCQVGDGAHASIKRQDKGVLYLSSRNFKDGKLDLSNVYYISEDDFSKHFKDSSKAITKIKAGDVALSIIGTIGEPYVVKTGDRFGLSSAVAFMRPDHNEVVSDYLYYWLKGPEFQQAIYAIKGGVAQGYVSLEMIKSLPLRKFEKEVQEKIVDMLSPFDNLIENNNRRIAILEDMAQSLYREWFVKFRFPGNQDCKYIDSALGKIPEGWEEICIAELGTVITGKTPSKANDAFFGDDVPFIKTPDMHDSMFAIHTNEALSFLGESSQKNKTIPAWSICVSCIGTIGVVSITAKESQTNQQINSLLPNIAGHLEFLFFYLKASKQELDNLGSSGATMGNVNKSKFEGLRLLKPTDVLIDRFHKIVRPMFSQILNLEMKNINLKQQRDLLLPKLISGQLALSE